MKRKCFHTIRGAAAVSLAFVLTLLIGCSGDNKEPARISLLHYFSGSLEGGMDDLVEEFNTASSSHYLDSQAYDHEAFKSRILKVLSREEPPDLFSYWAGSRTDSVAEMVAPQDDLWAAEILDARFSPSLIRDAVTYRGKKLLLPLTQHYVGFFYNKEVLAGLGEKEPETWDEFLTLCGKARQAGILPIALGAASRWPAQFFFDYLLLRTAGAEYRTRLLNGKASWRDPEVRKVFGHWGLLLSRDYLDRESAYRDWDVGAGDLVASGKALMTLMGTWLIGYFDRPGSPFSGQDKYGIFPFPSMNPAVPAASLGPVDGLLIPARARNPQGAREVLKVLAGKEAQMVFSRGSGGLAPSLEVPDDFYTPLQQRVKTIIADTSTWAFNFDLATPPEAADAGLDLFRDFLKEPARLEEFLARTDEAFRKVFP